MQLISTNGPKLPAIGIIKEVDLLQAALADRHGGSNIDSGENDFAMTFNDDKNDMPVVVDKQDLAVAAAVQDLTVVAVEQARTCS